MTVDFVRTVCGTCQKTIVLQDSHQINGMASCWYCFSDHQISRNVLSCPFRHPKLRKLIDRTDQDITPMEQFQKRYGFYPFGFGKSFECVTTVAETQPSIKNPEGER